MVLCFVPDCNHVSNSKTCKMFRFAKSPKRRNKWKALIRRAEKSPGKHARVCSCHFKDGDSKNVPDLFDRNQAKRVLFSSPKKSKQKKEDNKISNGSVDQFLITTVHLASNSTRQDVVKESDYNYFVQVQDNSTGSSADDVSEVEQTPPDFIVNCLPGVEENILKEDMTPTIKEVLKENYRDRNEEVTALLEEVKRLKDAVKQKDDELAAVTSELAALKLQLNTGAEESSKQSECQKRHKLILEAEISMLQKDLKEAKAARKGFTLSDISGNPKNMSHYTGLPNIETFELILGLFKDIELKYYNGWKVNALSQADQLFLTLFKLRRNPSLRDLARRFDVSYGTVENVFYTWLSALHQMLFVGLMGEIPSRFKNALSNPKAFKEFPNCRMVLDCTEIFAANPKKMSDQNDRYSNYKHRITYKALVCIAPNGTVTYVSSLYPGASSDKHIVENCGIIAKLEPGDSILADKGFLIGSLLPPGVTLNIPPFKSTPHLTHEQVEETLKIAQPRVHVERAIRVIKTFHILDFIPGKCAPFATKVFQVCAALSNFKFPLIREVGSRMK